MSFSACLVKKHSREVMAAFLNSSFDNDNGNGDSNGVLIIIHANQLQVHEHLDRGDVNSARIASAGAKKYALIAIFTGTILLVLFLVLRLYPS